MTFQRYLDHIEIQLKDSSPSYCIEYTGDLDEGALAQAFEELSSRHPVLRARIRRDGHGFLLQARDEDSAEIVLTDGGEKDLLRHTTSPWTPEDGVSRLIHIRGDGRGYVAFRMDHAVSDGGIKMFLFYELWRLYKDIVTGFDVKSQRSVRLPEPPTETLRSHWSGNVHPEAVHERPKSQSHVSRALQRVVQLGASETKNLVAAARSMETSVHALVCGSIMISHYHHANTTGPTQMLCLSPVDLRGRVTPPVNAAETTRFLGIHKAEVAVSTESTPQSIGHEVKRQLEEAIKNRDLLTDPIQRPLPWIDSLLPVHIAHVNISNYGVMKAFPQPEGLIITGFKTLGDSKSGVFPTWAIYTYAGYLNIRVVFPASYYSDEEVDQLVKSTMDRLASVDPSNET